MIVEHRSVWGNRGGYSHIMTAWVSPATSTVLYVYEVRRFAVSGVRQYLELPFLHSMR
jgi:hypothetical protein